MVEADRLFVFLRAINVGGRRVSMDRLRSLFETLGFETPETFIASGNVIVEASGAYRTRLERRIEKHLAAELGYEVAAFVRTREELAAIAEAVPFGPVSRGAVHVGFLVAEPDADASDRVSALGNDVDTFRLVGREVYWLARNGMGRSTITGAQLERALAAPTTMRNLNTVHRLLAKYD